MLEPGGTDATPLALAYHDAAFLDGDAARDFFTFSVTPALGPVSVDLLVVSFTLGPLALHVSILSLVGVAVAYYAARALF